MIHGKKNYLRVALCLTVAKSCPQPDPTSPAWEPSLPRRPRKLNLPFCKVSGTAEPAQDGDSFSYFWLNVSDHKPVLLSCVCGYLPFIPHIATSVICWGLFDIYRLDKPRTARTKADALTVQCGHPIPLAHAQLVGRAHFSPKLLLKRSSKLAAAVRVPLPPLPLGFRSSHTLSRAGRFTLIAVLSWLIHRLRKTALYSLQATDTWRVLQR